MSGSPFVVIESPFAGDVELHCWYADCLMFDSLQRGEVPFLGHLLYTRVLNDADPQSRQLGIEAHCQAILRADYVVVGEDLNISPGMWKAIELAKLKHVPVSTRKLGDDWQHRFKDLVVRTAGFR